jgi:hypothetical protein
MEMNITPLSSAHYYKTYVWLVEGDITWRAEIGPHVTIERERWFVLSKKELDIYYIASYPSILRCKMLELLAMEGTLVYIRCLGR